MRISNNRHKRNRDRGKRDQPAVAKHDIYLAAPTLSSEPKCNTPADLIIGTVDKDLRECCQTEDLKSRALPGS